MLMTCIHFMFYVLVRKYILRLRKKFSLLKVTLVIYTASSHLLNFLAHFTKNHTINHWVFIQMRRINVLLFFLSSSDFATWRKKFRTLELSSLSWGKSYDDIWIWFVRCVVCHSMVWQKCTWHFDWQFYFEVCYSRIIFNFLWLHRILTYTTIFNS